MDKVIIIRFNEIHLKGKNRAFFERLLLTNIRNKISKFNATVSMFSNRYVVEGYLEEDENKIFDTLSKVFGVYSLSKAVRTTGRVDDIAKVSEEFIKASAKTFRFTVNRADKRLPYTSITLAMELGGFILDKFDYLSVDLHNPDFIIYIDVRNESTAYVYSDSTLAVGGMPVGSSGKGLTLLSGGIDSPVSSYMMAKRGMQLTALHFWSYPYTSYEARDKVLELAEILSDYTGEMDVIVVPLTSIQEAIHEKCESNYMITLVRRAMMRIAEKIALERNLQCIINGENLGQVASQTIESINVTNDVITTLTVFRPLIGFDKIDIIRMSEKIGTYDVSIKPFEDCCTVFLPDSPVTKPTITRAKNNEKRIENYEELICEAIKSAEVFHIKAK